MSLLTCHLDRVAYILDTFLGGSYDNVHSVLMLYLFPMSIVSKSVPYRSFLASLKTTVQLRNGMLLYSMWLWLNVSMTAVQSSPFVLCFCPSWLHGCTECLAVSFLCGRVVCGWRYPRIRWHVYYNQFGSQQLWKSVY